MIEQFRMEDKKHAHNQYQDNVCFWDLRALQLRKINTMYCFRLLEVLYDINVRMQSSGYRSIEADDISPSVSSFLQAIDNYAYNAQTGHTPEHHLISKHLKPENKIEIMNKWHIPNILKDKIIMSNILLMDDDLGDDDEITV